jgi:hypothetical protein
MRLIASASTLPALEQLINKFFFSDKYKISDSLEILHPTKVLKHHRVIIKGNRYRFEQL